MPVKDIIKFNKKTFFNPSAWIDWPQIVAQSKFLWSILSSLFYPPAPATGRSFEEVMKDYGLSESDIKDGITTYRTLAFVFLLFSAASLLYAIYLAVIHTIVGALLALAVAILFLSQAFKYDFWSLQMRRRHLGLTFADWKRQYLGD